MQIMRSKKDIDLLFFCVGKYTRESEYFFRKYGKLFQNGGRRLQNTQYSISDMPPLAHTIYSLSHKRRLVDFWMNGERNNNISLLLPGQHWFLRWLDGYFHSPAELFSLLLHIRGIYLASIVREKVLGKDFRQFPDFHQQKKIIAE